MHRVSSYFLHVSTEHGAETTHSVSEEYADVIRNGSF